MKSIKILIIVLFVAVANVGFATNTQPNDNNTLISNFPGNDIISVVQQSIKYPAFAVEQNLEGIVLLSFSLDNNGKVVVNQSNTSSQQLLDYVVEELNQLQFENSGSQTYNMKFNFKRL